MRKTYSANIEAGRLRYGNFASEPGEQHGAFMVYFGSTKTMLKIIVGPAGRWAMEGMLSATSGPPWDHVSVSCEKRTPTWEEMAWVKDQFFEPEECVVQYHPPKSKYINKNENVLHLWRCAGANFPIPPLECV
jgi:hypothetical protein